mgnify:CR=1 FL=1
MTNSIAIYNFNQNQIRTTQIDSEPWFCLADCCAALEIKQNRDTATRLSEKGVGKPTSLQQVENNKLLSSTSRISTV